MTLAEVEDILRPQPYIRRLKRGHRPGEDVYSALGQTSGGRYLIVFFVYKQTQEALIVSALDMDTASGEAMNADNQPNGSESTPDVNDYISLGEFWDTHSLADYWEETEPAQLDFAPALGRRILVAVDSDLLLRVQGAAHARGISTESLVNLLLEQRMQQLAGVQR